MPQNIIEHPFFNDYATAVQSRCLREFGVEGNKRLKELACTLFESEILEDKWDGWETGVPRPLELTGGEILKHWETHAIVFLRDFF